jgi:hypothetical protein
MTDGEEGQVGVDALPAQQDGVRGSLQRLMQSGPANRLRAWWQRIQSGEADRALPYTAAGMLAILLIGAIVVPLSIPDPLPEPDPTPLLAERYRLVFNEPSSPTAIAGIEAPSVEEVIKTYGADGGAACTASIEEAYESLVTPTQAGVTFDRAGFAAMRVAHQVYCPERTAQMATYVQNRAARNAQAKGQAGAQTPAPS